MAQRDYVKKKTKTKNSSRIIPNLMMVIAIILVILFIAILYFVSKNKTNKPVTPPQNITERPQATLPDKPEERFTYLKELENPDGTQTTPSQIKPAEKDKERQQILDSFVSDKTSSNPSASSATTNPTVIQPQPVKADQSTTQTTTNTQTGSWSLQCGAFKDKSNADALKAKLAMLGVTSFVKNEKFYRVLVGPYKSKAEAEKAIATLKNNGITSCITTTK